ncbi:phosphoribosyl-ATP pyrophosphohydrolase [Paenibacillus polymyxa]|uniref:phosphoribosyl-ATP pyrophosphohydrolase n=1 Tax=Paenibacillus polymyxa TaxID=1406 RepID=UPI003D2BF0C6
MVLDDNDYSDMLDMKLEEELQEYLTAETADQVGELADLVEVVYAILDNQGISIEDFEQIRLEKKEKRGGFKNRLLLVQVDE